MSCSFVGRLIRPAAVFLIVMMGMLISASPASAMPETRPNTGRESPPDALAFEEPDSTERGQLGLYFAAAAATILAASLWLGRTEPLVAKGYVGPLRDAPFGDSGDDESPRGNAIL